MLFKPDINNKASALSEFVNLNPNTEFETMKKYIRRAEQKHLIGELLGAAFYSELDTAFNSEDPLSADQAALLPYIQDCLAHYTLFFAIDDLRTRVSDLGVVMDIPEQSEHASLEETFIFKKNTAQAADEKAESLLAYLEENKAKFTTWASDDNPAYTMTRELIINSAPELSVFVPIIGNSRRIFRRLRQALRDLEETQICGMLGSAFLSELKTAILGDSPSDPVKKVWRDVQRITAYRLISEQLPFLTLKISEDGTLVMPSFQYGTVKDQAANHGYIQKLANQYQDKALTFIGKLQNYLNDNPDDFPTWKNSDLYTAPPSDSGDTLDGYDYNQSIFPV